MSGGRRAGTITFKVHYDVEKRKGHYAALTKEFGLTVYAPTAEALKERVDDAIILYLTGFTKSPRQVFNYFVKRGIPYSWASEEPDDQAESTDTFLTVQVPA